MDIINSGYYEVPQLDGNKTAEAVFGISENLATKGKHLSLNGQQQLTTIRIIFDYCLATDLYSSLTEFSVALNSPIYLGVREDQYFGYGHRIRKFVLSLAKSFLFVSCCLGVADCSVVVEETVRI